MKFDTIFLDLDGVIFDFDRVFVERYGKAPHDMPRSEFNACFSDFIENKCFETLPLCNGIMPMLSMLAGLRRSFDIKIVILTACGGESSKRVKEVTRQKLVALDNTLSEYFSWDGEIFAYTSREKIKHFSRSAVLIDDYDQNIDAWTAAGGTSIWHDSSVPYRTTITLYELFYTQSE